MKRALKVIGPEKYWSASVHCAGEFNKEFPDRLGKRDGVIYAYSWGHIYVYRTKSQVVARTWINAQ